MPAKLAFVLLPSESQEALEDWGSVLHSQETPKRWRCKLDLEHESYEILTIKNAIRWIMVSSQVDSKTAFKRLKQIARDNRIPIARAAERIIQLSWPRDHGNRNQIRKPR